MSPVPESITPFRSLSCCWTTACSSPGTARGYRAPALWNWQRLPFERCAAEGLRPLPRSRGALAVAHHRSHLGGDRFRSLPWLPSPQLKLTRSRSLRKGWRPAVATSERRAPVKLQPRVTMAAAAAPNGSRAAPPGSQPRIRVLRRCDRLRADACEAGRQRALHRVTPGQPDEQHDRPADDARRLAIPDDVDAAAATVRCDPRRDVASRLREAAVHHRPNDGVRIRPVVPLPRPDPAAVALA